MPGALPGGHADFLPDLPESQTATQLPALVASDSALTVTDAAKGAEPTTQSLAPPNGADGADHLQVSPALTYLSLRNSTATATEVPSQASRIVSSASTIDAHRPGVADPSPDANVSVSTEEPVVRPTSEANRSSLSGQAHPTEGADNTRRSFRTPEMSNANMFAGSPAYSTLSRGDSVVSANSGRSSLAGPPASNYSSSHSRKSSVDKLALARSVAPHPSLREQPSLSSVRRNYRQHVRSATGSSEGSLLGTHASRRSSGAMSPPPMLSRSARSPNYFPPPASSAPMHDYASGFKPLQRCRPPRRLHCKPWRVRPITAPSRRPTRSRTRRMRSGAFRACATQHLQVRAPRRLRCRVWGHSVLAAIALQFLAPRRREARASVSTSATHR